MGKTTALAIGLLVLAVSAPSALGVRNPEAIVKKALAEVRAGAACLNIKDESQCLSDECSWCTGSLVGEACLALEVARLLPTSVATCKTGSDPDPDMLSKKKKAAVSCADNNERADCLDLGAEEGDCAWCKGDFMPPSCVSVKAAEWIPGTVATCKLPKKKHDDPAKLADAPSGGDDPSKKAAASCGDNDNKDDCLDLGAQEGDCAWCKGDFMPPSCVSVKAAEWIPGTVATCKLPKHKQAAEVAGTKSGGDVPYGPGGGGAGPQPGPGMGCMGAKTKKECLKAKDFTGGGCAWCESQWQGESCMAETTAHYMPGAKCKFPKEDDKAAGSQGSVASAAGVAVDGKHHGDGGSSSSSGGGGIPYGPGGDAPYGPGGKPFGPGGGGAGPQPGPGMGCMGAKTERQCLKAKDYMGSGCAWCESQWQGKSCMSEVQAKFQPMAKCRFPHHHKVEAS